MQPLKTKKCISDFIFFYESICFHVPNPTRVYKGSLQKCKCKDLNDDTQVNFLGFLTPITSMGVEYKITTTAFQVLLKLIECEALHKLDLHQFVTEK